GGLANLGVFLVGVLPHLGSPHIWHAVVSGGIAPHLALLGVVNFPLKAWRQQLKTKKAQREANGLTIEEAERLAKDDPSYAISIEQLKEWHEAGLFKSKDLRKALKKEKKEEKKEKQAVAAAADDA